MRRGGRKKNISKVSFHCDEEGTRQESALVLSLVAPAHDVETQELMKIDGTIHAVGGWILMKII